MNISTTKTFRMKQQLLFDEPKITAPVERMPIIQGGAIFSKDHLHRYALWRLWDTQKPAIMFIGLNPSRADETYNDATIIRCKNFAEDFGFGRMHFLNLYSFITPYVHMVPVSRTDENWWPLKSKLEVAVGADYMQHFISRMNDSGRIVCCW